MTSHPSFHEHLATFGLTAEGLVVDDGGTLAFLPPDDDRTMGTLPVLELAFDGEEDGEFEVGQTLGTGGMGVVRSARQRSLDRDVAIKQVRKDRKSQSAGAILLREARITGLIEHPNVVPVHVLGTTSEGAPVFVMKHIDGVLWDEIIRDPDRHEQLLSGRDAIAMHCKVLRTVCNAISFAHARGIIHRDIKPSNVMIGTFGEVYLLDWGIAVGIDGAPDHVPRATRVICGTPGFMAPEMARGDPDAMGTHTDIYLLGACLYRALTGKVPHPGASTADRVRHAWQGKVESLPDDTPAELAELCRACLASRPSDRPESADHLRRAILSFEQNRATQELVDQARERWVGLSEDLAQGSSSAEIEVVGVETRFALEQALRTNPDHAEATALLEEVLEGLARNALVHDHPERAAALIAGRERLEAVLEPEIDRARQRIAARNADAQAMAQHRVDHDRTVGSGRRMAIQLAEVAAVGGLLLPVVWLHETGRWEPGFRVMIGLVLLYALAHTATMWFGRSKGNEHARRVSRGVFFNTWTCFGLLGMLWLGGAEPWTAIAAVMLVSALTLAHHAMDIGSEYWRSAGVAFALSVLVIAFHDHVWLVAWISVVTLHLTTVLVERAFRRPDAD